MRSTSTLLPLLCATLVSCSSFFGSSSQQTIADDSALAVPGKNPLFFCKNPSDYLLTIDYVDLVPNPPIPGANLSIVANGTFSKSVEPGAKVFLQVKYGLITIIKQEADLCDELANIDSGLDCPLKSTMSLSKQVAIPKQVPPGKYTVLADVKTVDEEEVTCMQASVIFTR